MANPTPRPGPQRAPQTPSDVPQSAAPAQGAPTPAGLAPLGSTAVALPQSLADELAQAAKDEAALERPSVGKISLRAGQMSFMNQAIPGNKIDVVVLAAGYWNKYYERRYNPNVIVNPTCFAVSAQADAEMEPHENVENPQNDRCATCDKAQWGSAGTPQEPSRGKACKETRRLIVMPVAALESVDALLKAEFAIVDVPVTSVRNYANYVNTLSAAVKRPMWSVVTALSIVPDAKTQFKLVFTPTSTINDEAIIVAIKSRLESAKRAATVPYDEAYLAGEQKEQGNGQGAEKPVKFAA
jgi:hypothetical protein